MVPKYVNMCSPYDIYTYTIIVNSAKEIIEIRKKERNDWFDDEYREIILEKNKARNKCLNRNTGVNREDYEQKRSEARNLFRKRRGNC
jgi:hypothetical protein